MKMNRLYHKVKLKCFYMGNFVLWLKRAFGHNENRVNWGNSFDGTHIIKERL